MDDIVPGLLDEMKKDFQSQYSGSPKVKRLKEKLNSGKATYSEANEYAAEVGEITKNTYERHLTSDNLPDGKCYYNIADRVTSTTLHDQYELIADYAEQVQADLNKKAGIGLKAQRADEDKEGYHSLANYMSSASTYTSIAKSVAQSAERFARSTVDNSVKKNAEFQSKAGMKPKIVRSGGSGCCAWCSGLSGTYDYPKVPKDVYARHNNCTCTVEYDPGSGKRQDVHTKQWRETDSETLQRRQTVGLNDGDSSAKIEYRKSVGFDEIKKLEKKDRDSRITSAVNNGDISLKINSEMQGKHMVDSDNYNSIEKKSYFTISEEELQIIIDRYHGTGTVMVNRNQIKEIIVVPDNIGVSYDYDGNPHGPTNKLTVHYSKNRTHAVPARNDRDG